MGLTGGGGAQEEIQAAGVDEHGSRIAARVAITNPRRLLVSQVTGAD
jgi:hypothetical protein